MYSQARDATNLPVLMTPERGAMVLALTIAMCAVSALLAMRKLRSADRRRCSDDNTGYPPIVVEGVGYEYDSGLSRHHVLRDVGLEIRAGEIVILTGPSGSGKTTLITLIGALRAMQSGSIRVFGSEVAQSLAGGEDAGAAPYRFYLPAAQPARLPERCPEHIDVAVSGAGPEAAPGPGSVSRKCWTRWSLLAHIDKYPDALSGGQKQQVGIAAPWPMAPE